MSDLGGVSKLFMFTTITYPYILPKEYTNENNLKQAKAASPVYEL